MHVAYCSKMLFDEYEFPYHFEWKSIFSFFFKDNIDRILTLNWKNIEIL